MKLTRQKNQDLKSWDEMYQNVFYQFHSKIHDWQNFCLIKKFQSHQLPDSPCQRQIWPVKSGAKLKPGCYSDMTLNFFSPSKLFANNGYLSCIDKPVLAQFTLIFQISVYYCHHTLKLLQLESLPHN